ncbi:hypothetical protein ASPZODRAFT_126633 [Penicilliopsis zonata CBS 506.65]|uniref:Profilin n=1 Tax=Penicilliopsis zonata CBS 506.65 TaxID=1073090 RepID=A0A1L9SUE2_9EURO|nr:hypothetical protein ASPZODRAFT_126633 [Penicilliopsis zonata CBS 506.65]OJJ50707.1 hypothetical protein ASPZODRAFT_126633 [Penicilliopsis zonata CBS 506.65]
MSAWQPYVDSSIMGSGQFDKAAVLSYDIAKVEAGTPGYTITDKEIESIRELYKTPSNAFAHGITIGGEKFFAIKADERSLYGKKGKEGIVLVKSKSCVFVAHHTETAQTPTAAIVLENLVDYVNKN